jgi:hypothetical protein
MHHHHAQQVHGKRAKQVASFEWSDDLIEAAARDTESSALYPPTGALAKTHNSRSSVPAILASTGTLHKSASNSSTSSAPTALTKKLQARVAGTAAITAPVVAQPVLPVTAAAAATAVAEDPNAAYRQRKLAEGDLCWALNELTADWLSSTAEGKLVAAHRPRLSLPLFADSTYESAAAPAALIESAQGIAGTLAVDAAAFCLTETAAAAAVAAVPESNGVANSSSSSSSSAVGAWQRCVVSGYDPATALFHGVWAGSAEPWALPALLVCFSDCSSSNSHSSYTSAKYSAALPLPAPQGKAAVLAAAAAAARGRRGGLARRQAAVTRLSAALSRRRSCEALLAYAQYVKCMPVDAAVVGTLGDGTARRALALALGPAAERAFGAAAAASGASHRPGMCIQCVCSVYCCFQCV